MAETTRVSLMLKMLHHAFARRLNRNIEALGLTKAQCDVLGYLKRHEGETVYPADLEHRLRLQGPTVTGLVKRLAEKGFVQTLPSATDGRRKELRLTDKSRAMHEGMLRYLDEQEEVLLHGLSGAERETLLRLLGVMLSNMQDE